MKNGRKWSISGRLEMQAYGSGALANVCWTPQTPTSTKVKPHVHTFYELVFVETGTGSHVINRATVTVAPGYLALLPPGIRHDPRGLVGNAKLWILIFNAHALSTDGWPGGIYTDSDNSLGAAQLLVHHLYRSPDHYLGLRIARADRPGIIKHLREIAQENAVARIGSQQLVASHLNILLVDLLRRVPEAEQLNGRSVNRVVSRAMTYIDLNYKRKIGLTDIARSVGRSPAHLTHLLRLHTGMSAVAWLCDRRLWEAKNLLLTSRLSIGEIAATLGYANARHFSTMFRRRYGDSPLRWRSQLQH